MARYHIQKQTRIYGGVGYSGYTAKALGLPQPLEYETIEECKEAIDKLDAFNPVGWNVWDSLNGELVIGQNF